MTGKGVAPIEELIVTIRGHRVILAADLARIYGVQTRVLNQAVKRNSEKFPADFMFVLTPEEFAEWRSQFVTSKADRMGLRHPPMAFTEQGVAMVSSVLNSVRGERRKSVMLDADLASLYGVSTRALNQAVKRNRERFPEDFMFLSGFCLLFPTHLLSTGQLCLRAS
jgi:hypothetical protein